MTNYKYKGRSPDGAIVSGVVEAYDKLDAVSKIKETCSVVLEMQEVRVRAAGGKQLFAKIGHVQLSLMCKQFSIILKAGLPLVRTVELVADQTTDKLIKELLKKVAEDVATGRSISASFETRSEGKLPVTFIETIRAGEESGNLDTAFSRLADYYSKTARTKQKVTSALIYPAFTLCVAVVVIIIIMVKAVPAFTTSFTEMGTELPGITRALIAVSGFFTHYIILIIAAILALMIGLKVWSKTDAGRHKLAKLALKIPKIGKIVTMSSASQFANTMSTMMAAGLGIMQAVTITAKSINNCIISDEIASTTRGIEGGRRLGESMRACQHLPPLLIEMTGMGEETGALEDTLQVIGDYYDNETAVATENALKLLEPIIICVLAVFVVILLLAVYLPMFSLYGSI